MGGGEREEECCCWRARGARERKTNWQHTFGRVTRTNDTRRHHPRRPVYGRNFHPTSTNDERRTNDNSRFARSDDRGRGRQRRRRGGGGGVVAGNADRGGPPADDGGRGEGARRGCGDGDDGEGELHLFFSLLFPSRFFNDTHPSVFYCLLFLDRSAVRACSLLSSAERGFRCVGPYDLSTLASGLAGRIFLTPRTFLYFWLQVEPFGRANERLRFRPALRWLHALHACTHSKEIWIRIPFFTLSRSPIIPPPPPRLP